MININLNYYKCNFNYDYKFLEKEWSKGYWKLIEKILFKPDIINSVYIYYNFQNILKNTNITWNIFKNKLIPKFYNNSDNKINNIEFYWETFSSNLNVTPQIIEDNLEEPWDWY